ncbi:hypothetical protein SUDANB105_00768 [Streptomyces sp. enrichment culture]
MSDDAVQLERRIRFALSNLGESNSHHEFEALCLGLARRRITSNLLPATGPVSSGGDQGRDAESHWTNIPRELPGTSLFAALASTQRVVMAWTIQSTDVPGKIRSDLASICRQGTPVDRVIYFTVTAVPTRKRHDLIDEATRTHHIELEIWDAAALALHLADYDLFYLAVQYLHLPSDLTPPRPDGAGELPDWYVEARQRWQAIDEPSGTLGELVDLRGPLRHATFHDEARANLPEWIGHARALLDAAVGENTALRTRYEIVVATLRGLGDMHPADHLARNFFDTVTAVDTLTDPGILEDAVVLLEYGFGALVRGLTAITAEDLYRWQRLLTDKIDHLLDADPPANAMAHLLAMRARLALHTDMTADLRPAPEDLPTVAEVTAFVLEAVEAGEQVPALQTGPPLTDLDTGMRTLLRLPAAEHALAGLRRALEAGEPVSDEIIDTPSSSPWSTRRSRNGRPPLTPSSRCPRSAARSGTQGGVISIGVRLAVGGPRTSATVLFTGSFVPRATFEEARQVTIRCTSCCSGMTKGTTGRRPWTCLTPSAPRRRPCTPIWAGTPASSARGGRRGQVLYPASELAADHPCHQASSRP